MEMTAGTRAQGFEGKAFPVFRNHLPYIFLSTQSMNHANFAVTEDICVCERDVADGALSKYKPNLPSVSRATQVFCDPLLDSVSLALAGQFFVCS